MMRFTSAVLALSAFFLLAACQHAPVDRTGRLLTMAGEEAANISNKLERLSRQLNIADTQLRTSRPADADKTLGLARDTLTSADKPDLDDFHRIAAWTSISQLARRANDRDLALKASDLALAALNDVQPANQRPQYVLSLAWELGDLRGKEAAVELINSGGAWAGEIVDPGVRRQALVAFAYNLISYDAYENARTMLRRDPDPAWRTDTFLWLANGQPLEELANIRGTFSTAAVRSGGTAGFGGGGRGGAEAAQFYMNKSDNPASFGRDVRFESVFQQSH